MSELAETGKLRDDFVPSVWTLVGTDELRHELLRFAEEQLKKRGDDGLHAFVLGVMFGAWSAKVRAEAWWGLRRWYTSIEYASEGPLVMETGAIERFFPSVAAFFERFGVLLNDRETLAELTLQEKLASMLRYAPADALPALLQVQPAWTRLHAILVRTLHDVDIRLDMRSSIVRFFELVAGIDVARRTTVIADLASVTEDAVPDLAYEARSTAARIVERSQNRVSQNQGARAGHTATTEGRRTVPLSLGTPDSGHNVVGSSSGSVLILAQPPETRPPCTSEAESSSPSS